MPAYLRDQYNADGTKKLAKKDFDEKQLKQMQNMVNEQKVLDAAEDSDEPQTEEYKNLKAKLNTHLQIENELLAEQKVVYD